MKISPALQLVMKVAASVTTRKILNLDQPNTAAEFKKTRKLKKFTPTATNPG